MPKQMRPLPESELAQIGGALLGAVAACDMAGHASPAGTLDYLDSVEDEACLIVRDFIAWTSGRKSRVEGCDERLRAFVRHVGLSPRT